MIRTALVVSALLGSTGCGGNVASVGSDPGIDGQDDASSPDQVAASSPKPASSCRPVTNQGDDITTSCDRARRDVTVEVLRVDWEGPAWREGSTGTMRIRYHNASERGIHYLGVAVATTSAALEVGLKGKPSTDFYVLPACQADDRAVTFRVSSPLASGTVVRFTLSLAAARAAGGLGICGEPARTFDYDVTVP